MQQIGIEIIRARERIGLSREAAAEAIGIHWRTLQNIEHGGDCLQSTYTQIAQFFRARGAPLGDEETVEATKIGAGE